jgi:excisionase family DNA binding protein
MSMPTNDQDMARRPRGRPKKVYPYHLMQAQEGSGSQQEPLAPTAHEAAANLVSAIEQLIEVVRHPAGGVPPGAPRGTGGIGGPGGIAVVDKPGEMPRLLVGVKGAAAMLGTSVGTVNTLIYRGEILSVRVGTRRLVPVTAIEEWIARLTEDARAKVAKGQVP